MESNKNKALAKQSVNVAISHFVKLGFGLLRNKLIALCYGTQGMGYWSLLQSIADFLQHLSLMGADKSGVKKIAEEADTFRIAVSIYTLIFTIFISSISISTLFFFNVYFGFIKFSGVLRETSYLTISVYLIFTLNTLTVGYVLNGLKKIKSVVTLQLISAIFTGTITSLLILMLDEENIIYIFMAQALLNFLVSMFYLREINREYEFRIKFIDITVFKSIFKTGLVFWIPGVILALVEFKIRNDIAIESSVSNVGIYQASWTVCNMYIGVLLSMVTTIMYPKLCSKDKFLDSNVLINDQIKFSYIISLPVIVFIICFSDFIIRTLYSGDFALSSDIIRWQMIGVTLRIITFPLGYLLVTSGKSNLFVISQIFFSILYYILVIFTIKNFEFSLIGFAYSISYIFYMISIVYFVSREAIFKFDLKVVVIFLITLSLVTISVSVSNFIDLKYLSYFLVILTVIYSVAELRKFIIKN